MGLAAMMIAGGVGGGLAGALANKKDSGTDAGNWFAMSDEQKANAQNAIQNAIKYQGNAAAIDPLQSSRIATQEVQSNPMLGQLYGKGGTLDRTAQEEQDLAQRGYSLKPEDYEAYGQASGNIARMFGQADQGLAQALASRGLSSSGVAGQSFAGQYGNKLEQLGQLQTQIAQQRMDMNMQRLGQTRQFLSQLGQQGENAIQGQYGRQMGSEQQNFNESMGKAGMGMSALGAAQDQANEQLMQRQQTQRQLPWAAALSGMGQGAAMGAMANQSGQSKKLS